MVAAFTQLTNDGHAKVGPLMSDGSKLYFGEPIKGTAFLMSTPVTGGPVTQIEVPSLSNVKPLDFVSKDNEFLLCGQNSPSDAIAWKWVPGRPPEPLSAGCHSAWISRSVLTEAVHRELRILDIHTGSVERVSVPGDVEQVRWSASRGLMRFTLAHPPGEKYSLWEMRGLHGHPEPVRGYPENSRNGMWSEDGRWFVFQARRNTADGGDDIWIVNEDDPAFLQKRVKPIRLTQGPLDYSYALPTHDGKAIFVLGSISHMELVRYDAASSQYVPFLGGLNGIEASFSHDGKWIAYASLPERALWKIRPDGTGAVQLTFPPLEAVQPHWSPDDSKIAFMGDLPGKPHRVFLIPSDGGPPKEATDIAGDQGVPTWSPDGKRIVFGDLLLNQPANAMALHVLDLGRNQLSTLPGSAGMFTPRWSPDGNSILATSSDFHKLLLFNWRYHSWNVLATLNVIDNPTWGTDSSYIYFNANGAPGILDGRPVDPAVYRINVHTKKLHRLVNLATLDPPGFPWHGLTPDGTLLATRRRSIEEVYKLTIRW
jgi:Tol biopolymer transport system component